MARYVGRDKTDKVKARFKLHNPLHYPQIRISTQILCVTAKGFSIPSVKSILCLPLPARTPLVNNMILTHKTIHLPNLLLPLTTLINPLPEHPQRGGRIPSQLLIPQPHPDQVSLVRAAILKRIATMQDGKVVDEAEISWLHLHGETVLGCDEVYGVEGIGLCFGDGWQARGAG